MVKVFVLEKSQLNIFQREGSYSVMTVEINQWRAAIGGFQTSMQNIVRTPKIIWLISILSQCIKLYWLCCSFIVISVLVLPLTIMIQFLSVHCLKAQSSFLPTFSRIYRVSRVVIYITVELSKRMPLGFLYLVGLARYGYGIIKEAVFVYALFCTVCMTCDINYTQWVFRRILLSGDVETNPGPDTLDVCCWNLNSITAHEFLRVSLIEAYNSVYNYDLIGMVETHLDSTIDEGRLALDGYTFVISDHPKM